MQVYHYSHSNSPPFTLPTTTTCQSNCFSHCHNPRFSLPEHGNCTLRYLIHPSNPHIPSKNSPPQHLILPELLEACRSLSPPVLSRATCFQSHDPVSRFTHLVPSSFPSSFPFQPPPPPLFPFPLSTGEKKIKNQNPSPSSHSHPHPHPPPLSSPDHYHTIAIPKEALLQRLRNFPCT